MSAPPPLTALRAFEAFARHGAMTSAAEELCVTHGAVSRQVKALQTHLGVRLVEGPAHRLRLTEAGRRLAQRLGVAFAEIGQAVNEARDGATREIEISCLGTFAMKWLIPRLSGFVAAHPGVRVRLSESYRPVDFGRDRFDGAIRILEPHDHPPGAEITPFLDQHQGPVVAPGLAGRPPRLDSLAALPRLVAATFPESWRVWSAAAGLRLPPASVQREFAHNHSMIEAAAAGLGAAVAPWAFVGPDLTAGRLEAPFGFVARPSRFAFLRPVGRDDPAIDAFRDWLLEVGAASPPPPA